MYLYINIGLYAIHVIAIVTVEDRENSSFELIEGQSYSGNSPQLVFLVYVLHIII